MRRRTPSPVPRATHLTVRTVDYAPVGGISYNHQAPDTAAKLVGRFSCLKHAGSRRRDPRRHAPRSRSAGRSPASSNRDTTHEYDPTRSHSCSLPSTSWLPRPTSTSSTNSPTPSVRARPTATERPSGLAGAAHRSADPTGLRTFCWCARPLDAQRVDVHRTSGSDSAQRHRQSPLVLSASRINDAGVFPYVLSVI